MKLRAIQRVPYIIAGAAILLVALLQVAPALFPSFNLLQRLEWMSYDWRMRLAQESPKPADPENKLGFVYIGDDAITIFSEGKLGTNLQFGLKWPRHVYGRVVRELKAQGAKAVALDLLFEERRLDHITRTPSGPMDPDRLFARHLKDAGQVILGATREVTPHALFRSSAMGLGDISIERDADGVLRRVQAFRDHRIWHPQILSEARLKNWDLARSQVLSNRIVFLTSRGPAAALAITEEGYFDPSELTGEPRPTNGLLRLQIPFQDVRIWHLGIVLAATELGLDLANAQIEPHQIILRGSNGLQRVLPVDRDARFMIDWSLRHDDPAITKEAFESLVAADVLRQLGTNGPARFAGKLVLVGSTANGNELSDRGATPLEKDTFLTLNNCNVAHSILSGRFVRTCSAWTALLLIGGLGAAGGLLTLRLRVLAASAAVALVAGSYIWLGLQLFESARYWLPLVTPIVALLLVHFALVSYQAFFEQTEKRRIRQVFARIVSPNVVQELLKAEALALVGARRCVTVMFADVRGFTQMTDLLQAQIEDYIQQHRLSPAEAELYTAARAQEVLETVNRYLGLIADIVKKHEGTLDKYIGDCVMAFWGAPTPNEKHALACVRAAIEAQRAIHALNQERAGENTRREEQNVLRRERGEEPLPMLNLLQLGTGINTGVVTVGLMGSEAHIQNYTIFGREVNLAARLEPISGRGRIVIGEATYQELLGADPFLASTCIPLGPTQLKGFQNAICVYEVPWNISVAGAGAEDAQVVAA